MTDFGISDNMVDVHITDGNGAEKEATSIMGGTVYETESERLRRMGREEAREEYQAELEERDKELEERDKELEERDKELEEKNKRIAELEALLAKKE